MDINLARFNMVHSQVKPWNVFDPKILDLMQNTPRENFTPEDKTNLAYFDIEVPLPENQLMLSPKVIGRILESLKLTGRESILEIGTGSGYLTYLLSKLAYKVTSIEKNNDIYKLANKNINLFSLPKTKLILGDIFDIEFTKKFDVIVITGSLFYIPNKIKNLLKQNGKLFCFIEKSFNYPISQAKINNQNLFETKVPLLINAPIKSEQLL